MTTNNINDVLKYQFIHKIAALELTWKALKKFLALEGFPLKSPRACLQKAYALNWIDDEPFWLKMLDDQNMTSHTYKEDLAREIYAHIPAYHAAFAKLYQFLESLCEKYAIK